MEIEQLIPTQEFASFYNIDVSFIEALTEYGLVEIITINETPFINKEHINHLEKVIRLHYDLSINLEGIDAIHHLLRKVDSLQEEVTMLKNKLRMMERD